MIKPTRKSQIKTNWHLIDAKDQILGRLASGITPLLTGKRKTYFVSNLDCGDHVVVVNASEIKVTGRKEKQKKYYHYSGYPGGLKVKSYAEVKEKNPGEIIVNAVCNMLPKNKLRSCWLKKLHVFPGPTHDFKDKFEVVKEKAKTKKSDAKIMKKSERKK